MNDPKKSVIACLITIALGASIAVLIELYLEIAPAGPVYDHFFDRNLLVACGFIFYLAAFRKSWELAITWFLLIVLEISYRQVTGLERPTTSVAIAYAIGVGLAIILDLAALYSPRRISSS